MPGACLMRHFVVSYALRAPLLCLPVSKSVAKSIIFQRRLTLSVLAPSTHLAGRFNGCYDWSLRSGPRKPSSYGFCVRATEVSESGSVDSPLMQTMQSKIKEQLNADEVIVKDAYGDGRHVRDMRCKFQFQSKKKWILQISKLLPNKLENVECCKKLKQHNNNFQMGYSRNLIQRGKHLIWKKNKGLAGQFLKIHYSSPCKLKKNEIDKV